MLCEWFDFARKEMGNPGLEGGGEEKFSSPRTRSLDSRTPDTNPSTDEGTLLAKVVSQSDLTGIVVGVTVVGTARNREDTILDCVEKVDSGLCCPPCKLRVDCRCPRVWVTLHSSLVL